MVELKHIFGKPGEGVHSYRIPCLDLAAVDVFATIIVAIIIAYINNYSYWNTTIVIFLIGILAHRAVGVRTKIDKILFP